MRVDKVCNENDLMSYIDTHLNTEESDVVLREVMLYSKLVFSKPHNRLFAGQLDRMNHFALRYRSRKYQSAQYRLPASGLRTNLIPHQLHIAHNVGRRHAPRVLLADKVGLGKTTIEADMIIQQQLAGRAERVLLIVPKTLQHQWLVEMLLRFNLRFALFDDDRYAEAQHDSENAFKTEQLIICSLDFVRRNKQGLEQLAEQNPGVLLLTATPEQLGMESHFARLRLLYPNRFHDFAQLVEEQQHYRPVADAVASLLADNAISQDEMSSINDLVGEQDIDPLLQVANSDRDGKLDARKELIAMLMDRHGTSRVLFRNTRNGVKGFPKRELHQIRLPLPAQYQTAIKVSGIMGARKSAEERA